MTDVYLGAKQHVLALSLLLFGGVLAACAPSAVLGLRYQCVLHSLTGLRCPFCGMTRDFILMAHGSMPQNNPGSMVVALSLYIAYPIWLTTAALRGHSGLVNRDWVFRGLAIAMGALFVFNNVVA